MVEQYKNPYLDANIFNAWIQGEQLEVSSGVTRKDVADHLFNLGKAGTFKIYTSYLTMVESYKLRKAIKISDKQAEDILAFFEHQFIEPITLDRNITEEANRYVDNIAFTRMMKSI